MLNDLHFLEEVKVFVQSVPDKMNFKIGETALLLGVQAHVLRYWEEEFSLLKPKFFNKQRIYYKKDIELLFLIKSLLYSQGLTIQGANKHLSKVYHQWNNSKLESKKQERDKKNTQAKKQLQDILKEISSLKFEIK